ncbi:MULTISPECIES: Asp23/Gls24 family envelope stress response protein [Corynebacterium]|uniref:Asp23/Gls24 family envelope stress response protein n=1 Tax=Corynebacterium TaxID=1716 RepID=UPI00254B70C6|nr:Asp23/Gls24 family envelope stress response protein [Corynebacterium marquesiae]MDU7599699.1 Asp23/Gls24 family envelope stress response protein [Corynebacterium sp.]MDK8455021.1 Asp23/Gls24 family envelope stress response protein [Corynebacterium marquesiae]MDK8480464.1 Asp23/Gls24 family envelope stress response protein [Corynebacterium marquesiae]MDK8725139.1 Asp23/Gls24 family envelope stress response protein [Corynebacterium marquesiae]MDK8770380.1 Asp23/Gls24 family envelope stress re
MSENKTPAQNSDNQVPASEEREVNNNLETQYGTTTIDDVVVSKIAGIAAREVSGVDALGGGGARMIGNIRESFGASEDVRQGVDVEVADGTARIEIAITAEYGVAIHELAEAIRRNIMNAVERMTGLSVERVNVVVHDVKLPKEESEAEDQAALNQGQA